jgi:hypothetical protein
LLQRLFGLNRHNHCCTAEPACGCEVAAPCCN